MDHGLARDISNLIQLRGIQAGTNVFLVCRVYVSGREDGVLSRCASNGAYTLPINHKTVTAKGPMTTRMRKMCCDKWGIRTLQQEK
jgi:hypothetical protein